MKLIQEEEKTIAKKKILLPCKTKLHFEKLTFFHLILGIVAALPALNNIVNSKENGVEFQIGECKVKLAIVKDCKFTLTPSPDICGGKIPLTGILNHFLPKNDIGAKSNTFILPDKFDAKSLEIDKCKKTISFNADAKEKLDLIPGKLSMEKPQLALKINYNTGAVDWEQIELDIAATVTLAGKKVPITVQKKAKETFVKFSFTVDEVKVPDIVGAFSKQELAPPVDADAGATAKVTGLVIKTVSLSGYYDTKGPFEVVAKGDPQGTNFKSSTFFVIIQKPESDPTKVAALAKFDKMHLKTKLSELTGKDLTKVPFLNALELNFAFAISNDDFTVIQNEELMKAISGIIKDDKTIEKGVKIYLDIPVKEVFKKLVPDVKTNNFPSSLFMKATFNKDGIKFDFPDTLKSDLLQILKGLAPTLKDYFPEWLKQTAGPPLAKVKEFSFDYETLVFTIDADIDGPFKFGKILSLKGISLKVTRKGDDGSYEFSFTSSQTLSKDVILETKLLKTGETYEFEGSISLISTMQLIQALGANFKSEEDIRRLTSSDSEVNGADLTDVKLKAKFGDHFSIR